MLWLCRHRVGAHERGALAGPAVSGGCPTGTDRRNTKFNLPSVLTSLQLEREARHKADAAERAALEDARSHRASRPAPPKTDELEDFFSAVSSVEKGLKYNSLADPISHA